MLFWNSIIYFNVNVIPPVVSDSATPQAARLLCPWDFPGKNTGVGCHSLLQGIFPTQGSNPGLLHCRQILYCLSHQGSPVSWEYALQPSITFATLLGTRANPIDHDTLQKKYCQQTAVQINSHMNCIPFHDHFLINWRIIALQCCVSFRCTTMCISYMYTYTLSLLSLPPTPTLSHPSRSSYHQAELPVFTAASHHLPIYTQ